jgi:hypothetical protein
MYTKPPRFAVVFRFGGIFEIFNVRGVTHRRGINTAPMGVQIRIQNGFNHLIII